MGAIKIALSDIKVMKDYSKTSRFVPDGHIAMFKKTIIWQIIFDEYCFSNFGVVKTALDKSPFMLMSLIAVLGVEVSRLLTYKCAIEYDQGRSELRFLSIAQLEVGRRLIGVVDEALQIFWGYGYMAEQAIEHYYRDAWAIGVELGTEEELKDSIAERILGSEAIRK